MEKIFFIVKFTFKPTVTHKMIGESKNLYIEFEVTVVFQQENKRIEKNLLKKIQVLLFNICTVFSVKKY